jgi:hypothetical protein
MTEQDESEDEFAPVTPGEMLKAEFLAEYRLSQSRLARAVGISPQSYCRNRQQPAANHRRHGAEAGPLFRHLCGVLDEPAEPVRPEDGAPAFDAARGGSDQGAAGRIGARSARGAGGSQIELADATARAAREAGLLTSEARRRIRHGANP